MCLSAIFYSLFRVFRCFGIKTIMPSAHVPSSTVGCWSTHGISQSSDYGGSSDITKGYRRVTGCERPWQCKPMFSTDKPLGDTYAVICMTFNDSFTFWTQIRRGLTVPLSQTALCDLPSASRAALLYQCGSCLHPRTDHSVPKRTLLPSRELS